MTTHTNELAFDQVLDRLRECPTAMDVEELRAVVRRLVAFLKSGQADRSAVALVYQLARDPAFEVRCEVADVLAFIPDEDFPQLSELLTGDCHAYVNRAAKRAIQSRRQKAHKMHRTAKILDEMASQFADIEKRHGKRTANRVKRLCQRHNQLLLSSVAHDLASISARLQTSFATLVHQARVHATFARGHRANLDLLDRTIRDLRTFMEPPPVARRRELLAGIVSDAVQMATDNVRKYGLDPSTIDVGVDVPGWLAVPVARHLVVVALANVVKNAFESFVTGPGKLGSGRVIVAAKAAGKTVEIVVQDSGKGLSDEEIATASQWIPGRRNETKPYSTGYGLPIVARNLAAHGGSLSISSRENAGTTITIRLPLEELEDAES